MEKLALFIVFFLLLSCSKTDYIKQIPIESKIVVEGWIEEGDTPQVLLSSSIPIATTVDSTTTLNHVIRSAKVTVSDGTTEEVLRLKSDNNRIPPFVYYGSEIVGEIGKTYILKIEYLNVVLHASTTIPASVPLKEATYVKNNPQDSIGYVFVKFDDPVDMKNYYQIATRLDQKEPLFVPALYGNLNDVNFALPTVSIQVNRGILIFPKSKYKPYFKDGDLIEVKLRTMNKEAFDFWNGWQNDIVNGRNPIYPSNTSLKSNIKGGIGIWAGYGHSELRIQTKKN